MWQMEMGSGEVKVSMKGAAANGTFFLHVSLSPGLASHRGLEAQAWLGS